MDEAVRALKPFLPRGHGEPELVIHGRTIAAMKVREIQILCDTDVGEIRCVRWQKLDREELLVAAMADPASPARVQALFDGVYGPPPAPMEV